MHRDTSITTLVDNLEQANGMAEKDFSPSNLPISFLFATIFTTGDFAQRSYMMALAFEVAAEDAL